MKMILHWLVSGVAVLITAYILPGVHVSGFVSALILAIVLGAINMFIRPALVLLTLPITVLTLGLFILVVNGLLILLAAAIVPGFTVANIWWAIIFGLVLAIVGAVLHSFEPKV
jgi:putative membrane protein